ncbi:MAG: hypothetical protein RMJ36_00340 [Candidatus Calescibacterium sp.]|nr:hypothetical protein [Candidatus Calescibacterium sp.]MDW8132093.1 hypothetical protein [Candidatus Calescibacterium sp.]
MQNLLHDLLSTSQDIEKMISKEEIEEKTNLKQIENLIEKFSKQYIQIKQNIYNILYMKFKNSIIYSKQIEEKLINADNLFLEFIQSIQTTITNIQEIQKTFIPQKERLLKMQIEILNQQRIRLITIVNLIISIITDIVELLEEFSYERIQNSENNMGNS